MTVFAAGRVVTGSEVHTPGWIGFENGVITGVGAGRPDRIDEDLGDATLVAGFVDLHTHGGGGGSYSTTDQLQARLAIDTHRRHGTTTTMASLVTGSRDELLDSVTMLTELYQDGLIAGIHLEGPWISPHRCGAHDPTQLRDPDPAEIDRLLTAGRGGIAMVTLAPELPGGQDSVRQFADAGVIAAVGHTEGTYDDARRAIDNGATAATHLFNAMRPIHHREPGPIVALLEDPRVTVELIADHIHVHPALHGMVSRTVGPERVALVTDAMSAADLGDGTYRLGQMDVDVLDGVAKIAGTDILAGSTTTMDTLFRGAALNLSGRGATPMDVTDAALVTASRQASGNPARVLGSEDIGRLGTGLRADIVVLDGDLRVRRVIVGGIALDG